MKKGYTLIEILLCLGAISLVIIGSFTLFGKFNLSLVNQTVQNNEIYNESILYKELNDVILDAKYIEFSENSISLNENTVLYLEGNKLYLNNKCLIEKENLKLLVNFNRIFITIGDDIWCFRSINMEI